MGSVKNTTDLIALPDAQCSRCRMGMVVTQFCCCLQDHGPRLFAHMVYTCAIQHIRNSRPRNTCFACNVETGGRYLIGNILFLRSHTFSRHKLGLDCHPERSEGSASPDTEILSAAKDDSQDPAHVRSREALSPNVCAAPGSVNVPEKCVMYLAPARGATTCHAQQRPKCSGTPCGCQDNSRTLLWTGEKDMEAIRKMETIARHLTTL